MLLTRGARPLLPLPPHQGPRLFIIQQRAPAIAGRQRALAADAAEWLAAAGAGSVLVLSGLDAGHRREAQLEGPQERSLAAAQLAAAAAAARGGGGGNSEGGGGGEGGGGEGGGAAALAAALAGLALGGFEAAASAAAAAAGAPRLEADALSRELELHSLLPPWPLLAALAGRGAPALLLGRFAAEGDNVGDGLALAGAALELLAAVGALPAGAAGAGGGGGAGGRPRLETPPSWAGLYGRPAAEVA